MPFTAKDVAAADDDADLDAGLLHFDCLAGQAADHLRVDAVIGLAEQGFAGELEQDAFVLDLGRHARLRRMGKTRVL